MYHNKKLPFLSARILAPLHSKSDTIFSLPFIQAKCKHVTPLKSFSLIFTLNSSK